MPITSQTISTADYVNNVFVERNLSAIVLKNIFPGIVEPNGKGVTDKYTTEDQVLKSGLIIVNRIKPIAFGPRELGKSKNGGNFSNEASASTETETQYVKCLIVVDQTITIALVTQQMIPTDLLAQHTENWSGRLNNIINGATIAEKFFTTFEYESQGKAINQVKFANLATDDWALNFMTAHSYLTANGDPDHGVYSFPDDGLVFLVKAIHRPSLIKKGVIVIGGANYAYDILKSGAIDGQSKVDKLGSGFIGVIDGVETHEVSALPLLLADAFLGFPDGTLAASGFLGYCSSEIGTSRGVAMANSFKVVDTRGGQGIEVQPLAKIGLKNWYPLANSMLEGPSFDNPYTWLKTIWGSGVTWGNEAYKSRLFPTVSISAIATTGFTASATALDDQTSPVDHKNATLCFYQGDAAVTELASFIAGYKAASVKGTATSGTAKTVTLTADKYLNVLAVADDGSLAIASEVVA